MQTLTLKLEFLLKIVQQTNLLLPFFYLGNIHQLFFIVVTQICSTFIMTVCRQWHTRTIRNNLFQDGKSWSNASSIQSFPLSLLLNDCMHMHSKQEDIVTRNKRNGNNQRRIKLSTNNLYQEFILTTFK